MKNILLTICAIIIGLHAHAQNFNKEINLNTSFSKGIVIHPFSYKTNTTGIAVTGHIIFNSDTSFIRIIVDDGKDNVYLLYEIYPIADNR